MIDPISQSDTNRLQILASVGVSEIGRKSVLISIKTLVFWIGMTFAFFYIAGTDACWMDALKIEATGRARIGEYNIRTHIGI